MSIPGNEGVMKAKLAYHPLFLIWKLLNSLFSSYRYCLLLLTLKNVGQHEQLTHDGPAQRLDATSKPIHITSVMPIIRSVRSRLFTGMPSSSMMHEGCIMYFSFLSSRRLKDQLELEQKKWYILLLILDSRLTGTTLVCTATSSTPHRRPHQRPKWGPHLEIGDFPSKSGRKAGT